MRRFLIVTCTLALFACLFSACSGGGGSTANLAQTPEPISKVAGLEQLQVPEGVDQALWQQIKEVFAVEYAKAEAQRATSAAPQGEGNRIPDFQVSLDENNDAIFSWSYRNIGDYDQNGEANLADLTQIALNYGVTSASSTWQAERVVDGDNNGEINLADITPIAINYSASVASYKLATSLTGADATWEKVDSIAFGEGTIPVFGGFLEFQFTLGNALLGNGNWYRISPNDGSPGGAPGGGGADPSVGIPSNEVLVEYSTSPQNLIATSGSLIGEVQLIWDTMVGADFYPLFRAETVDGTYSEIGQSIPGETTYSDTTVLEDERYWYKVSGVLDGEVSDMSDPAEGWSNTTPDAPTNVQASDGESSSGITVSWAKSTGATGYNIFRDTEDNQIVSLGDVDTWEDLSILDLDPHNYWVCAVSYTLESVLSNPDTGYLGTLPTVISTTPEKLYNGVEVTMGATVTGDLPITYAWNFGGGATPNTSNEEAPTVTISPNGEYSGSLTCTNAAGSDVYLFSIGEPMFTELLIVYNSSIPEDLDLVEYYSSPYTGRAIHSDYRLGLPLGDYAPTIDRAEYELEIRDEVKDFLDTNTDIKNNIKYILLMKGMPHQIPGANEFAADSTFSSVDSELCVLYEDGCPSEGWLWSDTNFMTYPGNGFHLIGDVDFTPDFFPLRDGYNAPHALNYLVGRLSAYTYDEVKLTVDRSLAADTSRTGWVIFDSLPGRLNQDTMVDPVWMYNDADPARDSGEELLLAGGLNVYAEITGDKVTNNYVNLPEGAGENVIGYSSWGKHSGFPSTYILDTLEFTYRPGACFITYESFNGHSLDEAYGTGRRGQGQACDFLRMGGTVAIGNAYEPFTLGVGDERWVFDRYLNHGDRWIEAAYKGLRMVSWQEVVLGDPLCRVSAD